MYTVCAGPISVHKDVKCSDRFYKKPIRLPSLKVKSVLIINSLALIVSEL